MPRPAPDAWGILDKTAALVNIIAITIIWGLQCEGAKDVAGSRVVVFSRVGDWEGDDDAIYRSEAARKCSCFLAPGWFPVVLKSGSFICIQSCPSLLARLPTSACLRCIVGLKMHSKGPARRAQLLSQRVLSLAIPTALPNFLVDPGLCLCRPAGSWLSQKKLIKVPGVCQIILLVI